MTPTGTRSSCTKPPQGHPRPNAGCGSIRRLHELEGSHPRFRLALGCCGLAAIALLGTQACCGITGNYGGGPCPSEPEPERQFRVRLAATCSPQTRLWYSPWSAESYELSQAEFDALRAQWWHDGNFVVPGDDITVNAGSVTVWTKVPGRSKYVGFEVGLNRRKTTGIDIVCDAAGIPRRVRRESQ